MKRSLRKILLAGEREPQGAGYHGVEQGMSDSKDSFKVTRTIRMGSKGWAGWAGDFLAGNIWIQDW